MAQVTGNQNDDRSAPEPDEDSDAVSSPGSKPGSAGASPKVLPYRGPEKAAAPGAAASYFTLYKKGQGYWTRMITAAGAVILIALTAHFLATQLPVWIGNEHKNIATGIAAGFVVASLLWGYRLMNKPSNVDFLIATDSEMKKVNWASRSELIGSTKVVIGFMFLTAFVLFGIDQVFHTFFWLIKVLIDPPFFIPR